MKPFASHPNPVKHNFNETNLTKVCEAINNACRSYGITAAIEFCSSNCFPSNEELEEDNNRILLLTKFKEWLQSSSEADIAFNHRATAFLFYGSLQQLMIWRHDTVMVLLVKLFTKCRSQCTHSLDFAIIIPKCFVMS